MSNKKRSVILIILDGWGIGRTDFSNPIHVANPPTFNFFKENFPSGSLQASGISVGLPWGEEGNSEVGHLNMGAGRILYQNYPRITLAIKNGNFFQNEVLKRAFNHAKENNSSINLCGLLTQANVHASFEHLQALIEFAKKENFPENRVNLHLITDGRDSPPQSAFNLIKQLPHPEQLASLSGRYYTMDRDKKWERTSESYNMLIGKGPITENIEEHLNKTYGKNLNDEYIVPALVGPNTRPIKDNDSLLFFNFREDRMRQISAAFIYGNFDKFPVKKFSNLFVATMIKYENAMTAPAAYPPEEITMPLSKILSQNGKTQWRIAETEKYAHITYFFNGLREEPYPNEFRVLIPSQPAPHDKHPQMRTPEIATRLIQAIEEKGYDFILANFANADMVAHTGNFDATVQAIKTIDEQLDKISKATLATDSILLVTSDHGNAERLLNPQTGEPETKHDPNPVPIYIIANELKRKRNAAEIRNAEKTPFGVLADISPTVLALMGIQKPPEMTAQNLLDLLM